jgi:hypothetical protein
MCSGAMVFLFSCSHISFASEDIRWMNSAMNSMCWSVFKAMAMKVNQCSPTQHSITKSRVSLAHTTSLGNSSRGEKMSDGGLKPGEDLHTSDHLGNSSFW